MDRTAARKKTTAMISPISQPVMVPVDGEALAGDVVVPASARAVVLFAHGSGSSRHSPRNRMVAEQLRTAGLGTVLMDLLTEREDREDEWTAEHRFDIPLLGSRVVAVIDWLEAQPATKGLPVALFGASTGAAAALVAAAERPDRVLTVISRGGRPDLAGDALHRVRAPVLFIVGGRDLEVLELNQHAAAQLRVAHSLRVVPGATHLFEEPGTLEQVADTAKEWCQARLASLTAPED
ncbi:dienelactone hydrolase family protein [Streptomyces sp. NPDC001530]|uniref:dienelactone hydrolase family protein n=1 Tax=Streptomyces sp. NPDC001530 TaxID=3364582 RepID=UPI003695E17B